MPRRYSGTPLDSEWGKLKRRRELAQAITAQSLEPYSGTQTVTGHAVDDRWGQGLGKIGTAIIGAMANKRVDDESKELNKEFDTGRKRALDKVIGALQGTPTPYDLSPDEQFDNEQIPGLKNAAQKPDMMKAAIGMTDPYLQGDDVARAMINSQAYGKGFRPRSSMTPGKEGGVIFNQQTGEMEFKPWPKEGFTPIKEDIQHQTQLSRGKQLGTGGAEDETDPVTAQRIRQAESNVDLAMKPEIKKQTDIAAREAEKVITKPKIDSSISAQETKTGMLDAEIDQAKDQASIWTTGFLGAGTSWIPGTPAHDLNNTLATIKSNIGFDKLQEMRNNSPTGGALGQVSEFENRLLQSVWGALEQSQSPAQFKENLEKVRKQSQESWKRINEAYEQDYGVPYKEPPKAGGFDEEKEKRYQEWKARQ